VRVVEAVVLEAHAVGGHTPSSIWLEMVPQDTVPLGGHHSDDPLVSTQTGSLVHV
jgi:hypothetical protein